MIPALNFENDNNCCQSLRLLAELARQGRLVIAGERLGSGISLFIRPKESVPAHADADSRPNYQPKDIK